MSHMTLLFGDKTSASGNILRQGMKDQQKLETGTGDAKYTSAKTQWHGQVLVDNIVVNPTTSPRFFYFSR